MIKAEICVQVLVTGEDYLIFVLKKYYTFEIVSYTVILGVIYVDLWMTHMSLHGCGD